MPPICSRLASSLVEEERGPLTDYPFTASRGHGHSSRTKTSTRSADDDVTKRRNLLFSAVTGVLNDNARDLENPTFPPPLFLLLLFLTSSFQTLEIYHFRTLLLPFLPPFLFSSYFDSFHFQMDSSSINRGRRNLLKSAETNFRAKLLNKLFYLHLLYLDGLNER